MSIRLPLIFLWLLIHFSCNQVQKVTDSIPSELIDSSKTAKSTEEQLVLPAKVIGIVDGDTVDVLYHDLPLRIRMEHIDAPEKRGKQAFGNKAKLVISDLCFGQKVNLLTDGKFDMGGRLIAEILNEEGINVNKEMVRLGYAWHFKKYSTEMSYDVLEMEARKARRGLWQDENPIAPWDFR
jgi:endonuclease YncB( thermonuclease family)